MSNRHTPGPWEIIDDGRNRIEILAADADDSPHVIGICTVHDTQDEHANARLIAAAPTLAEALRLLILQCEVCDCSNGCTADNGVDEGNLKAGELVERARAALAEAGL